MSRDDRRQSLERRAYLKDLAARSARRWAASPLPSSWAGETRIATRNTVYELVDGVCTTARRDPQAAASRVDPAAFVGMRLVGWLRPDDPRAEVLQEWRMGAYAVLWRPRRTHEKHSAVALTSSCGEFRSVSLPAAAQARRASSMPPPPRTQGIRPLQPRFGT